MTSWTDPTRDGPPRPPGVVLHPARQDAVAPPVALPPGPALAVLVERHWVLSWHLPERTSFPSSLVPNLSHNLTREVGSGRPGVPYDAVVVTGVPTRRFDVDVVGRGFVLGTKFHPGALAAVTDVPAAALTDRTVLATDLLPPMVVAAYAGVRDDGDPAAFRHTAEAALAPLLDRVDPAWAEARDLVARIAEDDGLTTVAALGAVSGPTERTLQRLFRRFVGVSPKQAITRYRLQDAVHALDRRTEETLADLAARLGFFDQAHLAREFTRFVGIAPSAYRAGHPVRD
ncbi:helix-turn-helix domain-containing protein [Arsenicicoccus sp. oral taxon 190]|uniref:helix-turn-helix domain-containing protein n=1 Tax=Arsenicicoccus sp. oral taxon 190 TaxID=1658671 RepID=UPI000B1C0E48|nr:helix-turn-helix domain-containing protein [Arsenicicoccus sp. oral taxon 190]